MKEQSDQYELAYREAITAWVELPEQRREEVLSDLVEMPRELAVELSDLSEDLIIAIKALEALK